MSRFALWDRASDSYRRLPARDRRALRLGAILLAPALLWLAVVLPYVRVLGDLEERLIAEARLLEREKAVLAEGPTLPDRLESANSSLELLDARFVRSANPALAEAEITSLLEAVAQGSRVLLQEVRTTLPPPGWQAPTGLLPIRLSVRGESDYEGVLRFLNGMEQDPVLFRVMGLSVEPVPPSGAGGGEVQPGAMSFVVIVEAYAPEDSVQDAF